MLPKSDINSYKLFIYYIGTWYKDMINIRAFSNGVRSDAISYENPLRNVVYCE